MKTTASKILLCLFLLTQVYCAKQSVEAQEASGFSQNSLGQRISWKANTPIQLYFDPAFPQEFRPAVINAVNTWHKNIGRQVFVLNGDRSGTVPAHDNLSVIYWRTSWDEKAKKEQANTMVYWVDNQILEADIMFDAANFKFSTSPNYGQVDAESIALHELGHVLGLKHVDSESSVMASNLSDGTLRRDLFSIDIKDVKAEY